MVIVYYFLIWNKKEHNIIISRIINSHMGPMYIETLDTLTIYQLEFFLSWSDNYE